MMPNSKCYLRERADPFFDSFPDSRRRLALSKARWKARSSNSDASRLFGKKPVDQAASVTDQLQFYQEHLSRSSVGFIIYGDLICIVFGTIHDSVGKRTEKKIYNRINEGLSCFIPGITALTSHNVGGSLFATVRKLWEKGDMSLAKGRYSKGSSLRIISPTVCLHTSCI